MAKSHTNVKESETLGPLFCQWCYKYEKDLVVKRFKFYLHNTYLLPPKPKSFFKKMKQGIQVFYRKDVWIRCKATNNRLHNISTLKHELNGTKAYEGTSADEKFVVNSH